MDENVERAIRRKISGDREHHRYLGILDAIEAIEAEIPDRTYNEEDAMYALGMERAVEELQRLAAQKLEANLKAASG